MKTSLATVVMLGTLGLTVPTAHAERLTLQIEGSIQASPTSEREAWLFEAGVEKVHIEIVYESEISPVIFTPYEFRRHNDAIESISFDYFDANNNPVTVPLNTTFSDATEDRVVNNNVSSASLAYQDWDALSFAATYFATPNQDSWNEFYVHVTERDYDERAFYGEDILPILPNTDPSNFSAVLSIYLPEFDTRGVYPIRNVSFQYSGPDDDNDGVMNFYDECEASLTAPTLTIDGVDSGIANGADKDGCTIADHFAACEAQQTGGFPLAYSGPTMCERGVLYDAYRNELITYPELRQLRQLL